MTTSRPKPKTYIEADVTGYLIDFLVNAIERAREEVPGTKVYITTNMLKTNMPSEKEFKRVIVPIEAIQVDAETGMIFHVQKKPESSLPNPATTTTIFCTHISNVQKIEITTAD